MGLLAGGGTQVKTYMAEFSAECGIVDCSADSKVLTELNSNKIEVIEKSKSESIPLREEDVPGAILPRKIPEEYRETAAAMAPLPWS